MASWRRVRLVFAPGLTVEFVDRERGLRQVEGLAGRGTRFPVVIYGPEGCGKTAFLRQVFEVLKSLGYSVVYVNPLGREAGERLLTTEDVRSLVGALAEFALGGGAARLVDAALGVASRLFGRSRRIAFIADDVFQAIGVEEAELYVKRLLNLIEYPPGEYERIVVLVASSEGVTRGRISRHNWAKLMMMWNMPRSALEELYEQIPGAKPGFDEVWAWTGGNPRYLSRLYEAGWRVDRVIEEIVAERRVLRALARRWRRELEETVNDPDYLMEEYERVEGLARKLIELNMVVEVVEYRSEDLWIDTPPPERDPELGIGRFYAWATPLHREAVRRILSEYSLSG
ncbi:AAA ATPase [Pyrolobus fumarii 1A]|uniref:AAA ATPase n=1 Tax=Pyrolobus fumarii (strain DSM 11204 / 1A) TaxID=694429 RepID=G0EG83_PYRF1|nr:ATP-binding protein [Pyrolobus fumarii]AEM38331.1 AAA ATPase [Pyrolobus fumarii 1A]